ncbi:MAG TPA: hypothetical protein VMJ10_29195 [Kofleriaceae bacterium]|nr:hypothetical protein [Kofleriaceae bacterium]
MIGLKSISAVVVAVLLVAIAAARGAFGPVYLASLSGTSWFVIGAVASVGCALVGVGWRFGTPSRGAVALVDRKPTLVEEAETARELPVGVQRGLVLAGLVAIALPALGNHAAARVVQVPDQLAEPSPSQYCIPKIDLPVITAPRPTPKATTQAGCALVERAYALGYAKSLGSCAPKEVASPTAAPVEKHDVCTRRGLDEPYLHYAYRRLADAFGKLGSNSPGDAIARDEDAIRAHFDHADDLLADVRHAITGSPHASHHIWVDLPDPHPTTLGERFTGIPRCSTRFADLPLWPEVDRDSASLRDAARPGEAGAFDRSRLFEHVLGQLLFASRFGTTASCNDYTIHWGAPADACAQLAADPSAFLARDGALASVRAVLDRRRRQLAIIALDAQLGRKPPVAPPPVAAIVSLQCLSVGTAAKPIATTATIDGEAIAVRELHVAQIRTDADGPIDLYLALAALLAGTDLVAASPAGALDLARFPLTRLDELYDLDPFAGARWPLADPALVAVYPFEHHLRAFVDAFRRRYLPQRGRL